MSISAEDLRDYYDTSVPPDLLGPPAPVAATGATAGIPGPWTPAGSTPPATPADLAAGIPNVVVASPSTRWLDAPEPQYVVCADQSSAWWDGTQWLPGRALPAELEEQGASVMSETPEEPDVPPDPDEPSVPPEPTTPEEPSE